jgi:hypothetical protein
VRAGNASLRSAVYSSAAFRALAGYRNTRLGGAASMVSTPVSSAQFCDVPRLEIHLRQFCPHTTPLSCCVHGPGRSTCLLSLAQVGASAVAVMLCAGRRIYFNITSGGPRSKDLRII